MAELGYIRKNGAELIICKQSAISYPTHNHVSVYILGFVLEGQVELAINQESVLYGEGDAFLIPPYTPHCLKARSRYTLLSLCVQAGALTGSGAEEIESDAAALLRETIRQMATETRIMQALCSLIRLSRTLPAPKETPVSGLRTRLERHPERRYSIDDMAETAFVSKYHLIRTFKRETGLTPHQFQIQNRIRKAQKLLAESVPITETALATGFCDESHFIRHFERIVGLTPTEYKRACGAAVPVFAG